MLDLTALTALLRRVIGFPVCLALYMLGWSGDLLASYMSDQKLEVSVGSF